MAEDSPFIVDADWLQGRLGEPGLTIVDASWYLPAQKRDARAEYEAAHIPGARFLDQDANLAAVQKVGVLRGQTRPAQPAKSLHLVSLDRQ